MRLLSFSHDGLLYGAQRSQLSLLGELRRRGHDCHLAVPEEGDLAAAAAQAGIAVHIVPYPYPSTRPLWAVRFLYRLLTDAGAIRRLAQSVNPDILHYNTGACFAPPWALRSTGTPKIWHLRETVPMRSLLSRWIPAWSDAVVANCRAVADAWPGIARRQPIDIVYNGIEYEPVDQSEVARIRASLSGETGLPIVLFAGQLRPHKDPMAMVAVAARLRERGVRAKFLVLGDGPLRGELEREIARLSLADSVTLKGFMNRSAEHIAAADVVLIPSLVEPFPRVGLEAMSLQRPILATTAGGIPEQIVDGESGLLVPPGDHDALAEALMRLLGDDELRNRLALAGGQRYADRFSLAVYADSFLAVAERLLAARS